MTKEKLIHTGNFSDEMKEAVEIIRSLIKPRSDVAYDRFLELYEAHDGDCEKIINLLKNNEQLFRHFACEVYSKGFLAGTNREEL